MQYNGERALGLGLGLGLLLAVVADTHSRHGQPLLDHPRVPHAGGRPRRPGAITFLFIVPIAVMIARFYRSRPGYAIKYHEYLQVLAVLLTTVIFVLGWFAVGPLRSLTNPHHGIGVAMYVLILLQVIGGRLVRHIKHRPSLRQTVHRWSGRAIAILGIVQVPLGLTLYGSPKFTFVLFTLWMSFLLLLYFILDYRSGRHRDVIHDGRYEPSSRINTEAKSSSGGGVLRWVAPLAAGAGIWALLRGRNRDRERSRERSRSRSRARASSRARSRTPAPVSTPPRRGSGSYVDEEKYSSARRKSSGGGGGDSGIMGKVLGVGAALGAGALLSSFMGRGEEPSAR